MLEAAAQLASVQKEAAGEVSKQALRTVRCAWSAMLVGREALLAKQLCEESGRVLRLGQDLEKARPKEEASEDVSSPFVQQHAAGQRHLLKQKMRLP